MEDYKARAVRMFYERNLIQQEQVNDFDAYWSLKIFSLHTELQLLLYSSVILFTSGIGILIYQNIDTIGHIAILAFILLAIGICFYLCFKNSTDYKNEETAFTNPIFNYVLLAANLLTCIFIGYLQFQYSVFGTYYGLVTLLPALIALFSAYYFDNRSMLSIGLTGLAAYIGLSVNPQDVLSGNMFNGGPPWLSLSALGLGVALLIWSSYSDKKQIKPHFYFIYATFSLHLIAVALLSNCYDQFWPVALIGLIASSYYFHRISLKISAVSIFVFNILYAFLGFNLLLSKLAMIDVILFILFDYWKVLVLLLPVYIIASIRLFIKAIKNFNKNIHNENI